MVRYECVRYQRSTAKILLKAQDGCPLSIEVEISENVTYLNFQRIDLSLARRNFIFSGYDGIGQII